VPAAAFPFAAGRRKARDRHVPAIAPALGLPVDRLRDGVAYDELQPLELAIVLAAVHGQRQRARAPRRQPQWRAERELAIERRRAVLQRVCDRRDLAERPRAEEAQRHVHRLRRKHAHPLEAAGARSLGVEPPQAAERGARPRGQLVADRRRRVDGEEQSCARCA
jgi:hypothetical protein